MYESLNVRNCIIALVVVLALLLGMVPLANLAEPVEAKSYPKNGCEVFAQTENIIIFRCYDDMTNKLFYSNSVGFIGQPVD